MSFRLLMLALGNFAVGTGSFVFAGLLGGVARDLSVSVGAAGQLITAYAVVYAIGSPILVTVTSALSRRRLLLVSLIVFSLANVAAVVLTSYVPLMASRVVAAGAAAVFSPTAIAIAASLAPPERRGKALATVTGGLTIAFAFGIPLVGVLGAVAVAGIAAFLPNVAGPPPASLGERVRAARQPVILATLALTAIGLGSGFVVFTYMGPLLAELTGFGGPGVSAMLLVFGVVVFVGTVVWIATSPVSISI